MALHPRHRQRVILGLIRIHEQLVKLMDEAETGGDQVAHTELATVNLRVIVANSQLAIPTGEAITGTAVEKLAGVNRVLDGLLSERVNLHERRRAGEISVANYLAGLKAVRDTERVLEQTRSNLGAVHSRAYEITTKDDRTAMAG